ncbi:hypothetical protein F5Y15DRAFT_416842 [Xylariaceae sp. FL0016]|nr:hypothetical protein F5Y15DRAFT_416842 [Xylariaceae sp. FL0016]
MDYNPSVNGMNTIFNKWCTCAVCLKDAQGTCEMVAEVDKHLFEVRTLLSRSPGHCIALKEVDDSENGSYCHKSLLKYYSQECQSASVDGDFGRLELSLGKSCIRANICDLIATWCYTGTIEIERSHSMYIIDEGLEKSWNVAVSFGMPELANHIMRMIIAKYTWSLGFIRDNEYDPHNNPYYPSALQYVFKNNSRNTAREPLLLFCEDLLKAAGPLSPGHDEKAWAIPDHQYAQPLLDHKDAWLCAMAEDMDFTKWIWDLGGPQHENPSAVWPTHHSQWHKYMVPIPERDVKNWGGCKWSKLEPLDTTVVLGLDMEDTGGVTKRVYRIDV